MISLGLSRLVAPWAVAQLGSLHLNEMRHLNNAAQPPLYFYRTFSSLAPLPPLLPYHPVA